MAENTVSQKKNVYERIQAVMADLPYVQKKKAVNLGGAKPVKTLAYEDLAAEVQPLLVKHGLVLLSTLDDLKVETIESEKPGYNAGDPPKKVITTIATVKMRFRLLSTDIVDDQSKQFIEGTDWLTFPGMGYDTSDKAVGKATTYAAKDFMRKVFVVPSGEEPEDDNHERPARKASAIKDASDDEREAFPPTSGPIGKPPSRPSDAPAASKATTAKPKFERAELERMGLLALCGVHKAQFGPKATTTEIEAYGGSATDRGVKDFGLGDDQVAGLRAVLIGQLVE